MEVPPVELRGQEEGISKSTSKLNPLKMEHVVQKILINLDLKSLRVARQVNQLWNSEGRKILFKNNFIRVPHTLFSRENRKKKEYKKLTEHFKTFLSQNSFKFPHLSIHNKSDPAVLKVLGEGQTQEVKSLRWPEWYFVGKERGKLLKSLLYQLPNLKYLDISPSNGFECDKVIMDFCLATKTKFKKETENQNESKSKLPLVLSRFLISCDNVNSLRNLEIYEQFSKCEGARIKSLKFGSFCILKSHPELQNRIIKIIQDFLWRSRENLVELTLVECEKYISQIIFPEMPNLSNLDLRFQKRSQDPALNPAYELSQSFKFAEVTPNLKEFRLSWLGDSNSNLEADGTEEVNSDIWTRFFQLAGSAPSVQKFKYQDPSTGGHNIEKLLQIFPNLQHFETLTVPNFESALTSVWKYGENLRSLKLRIQLDSQALEFSKLCRILTGFSQETVDKMKMSEGRKEKLESVDDVEILRMNPSILDLKKLTTVQMFINFSDDLNKDEFPEQFLSVAGEFAFKLMPNADFHIRINFSAPNARAAARKLAQLPNVSLDGPYLS